MISFSFIMFLTISIFTVFLHLNVFPQLKDEITYSNLELCVKTSESLDNHIEKIDDITKKLISNKTLMQILTKANSGYLFDSYEKNINVFSDDERYTFIYNKNSSNLRVMLEDPYYVEKLNQKSLPFITGRAVTLKRNSPYPLYGRFTTCILRNMDM